MKKIVYIVAMLFIVVSCGTTSKSRSTLSVEDGADIGRGAEAPIEGAVDEFLPPQFIVSDFEAHVDSTYKRDELPLVYTIEGIKRSSIYDDVESAVALFDTAIEIDPSFSVAYFEAGRALMSTDPQAALTYARKADELESQMWYKSVLGHLLLVNRHYDDAEDVYEELIELEPKNPENYSMLAALYDFSGQPYTALKVLERAEKALGKVEQLTKYKREILLQLKLYDLAIKEGEELIEGDPYDYHNYLVLAQLFVQTNKDSLAKENYKMALKLNPNGSDVLASMSDYYNVIGDDSSYLAIARRLITHHDVSKASKLSLLQGFTKDMQFYYDNRFIISEFAALLYGQYPDDFEIMVELVKDRLMNSDLEGALGIYKSRIGSGVGGIELFQEIINLEGYLEREDSVSKYLDIALKYYPDNSDLYLRQAWGQVSMNNERKAVEAFKSAFKHAESDSVRAVVHRSLGDMYTNWGKRRRGYREYERALKYRADDLFTLNNYAYFLSEEGRDLERALEMSRKVVEELETGNPTYIDTYGWVLYKLGRYEEARVALKQAVSLDPENNSTLLIHYGDVLHALGEDYLASVYWRRAKDAGHDAEEIDERLRKIGEE